MTAPDADSPPDLFLSYSRQDLTAAGALAANLRAAGLHVAMDMTHIAPGEDWTDRLDTLLRDAAKVVFLVTPASVTSPACALEIERALAWGKPVLPVMTDGMTAADLPPTVVGRQYLRLGQGAETEAALARLVAAIRTDLDWERGRADYARLAERGPGAVIRGPREVAEAEAWMAARPVGAAPVPETIRALVIRSRRRLGRIARGAVAGLGVVALGFAGLAAWGFDLARTAERQAGVLLAGEGERLAGELRTAAALVVMLEAAARAGQSESARLQAAFARVLDRAERERTYSFPGDAVGFEFGNALHVYTPGDGQLWRVDTQAGPVPVAAWPGTPLHVAEVPGVGGLPAAAVFAGDGRLFAALVDPATGETGAPLDLGAFDPAVFEAQADIGPDGRGLVSVFVRDTIWQEDPARAEALGDRDIAFDLVAMMAERVGDPEVPWLTPVLRVLETGETRLFFGDAHQNPDDDLLIWIDGSPPLSDPAGADEEAAMLRAIAVDCLARSGDPAAVARFAEPMLRPIRGEDEDVPYLDPMMFRQHCVASGDTLLHTSSHFTSAGTEVTVALLDQFGGPDAGLYPTNVTVGTGWQSRPSVLWPWDDAGPLAAIGGIAGAVILADPLALSGTPLHVPFAHNVGHVVLTPDFHLVAFEGIGFGQTAEERRVTVLAMPELAPAPDAPGDAETAALPRLAEIFVEEGRPFLALLGTGEIIALPPQFGPFTPVAPFGDTGEVVAAVDNRRVERWRRAADGTWQRVLLFQTDAYVRDLHVPRDGGSVVAVLDHGLGEIEARLWSLADGRVVTVLGENYKWASFEEYEDGGLRFAEIGASFRLPPLPEAIARAEAALPAACRPAPGAGWRASPCWPGDVP